MKNASLKQTAANPELTYRYKRIKEYIYDMQGVLGKGNFSTVYRGRNQTKNQDVAVKVVKLSSLTFQKLEELLDQEIAISRMVDHDNAIRCHEVLKSANNCYFISELCEEGTLEEVLKKRGPLSEDELKPYLKDVYEGLRYLNQKGIVHRDIKLANIFMKGGKAKLADFGFAVYSRQQFRDVNIGSPLYMSPEGYVEHIYGPKTDVWAFGLVVYELLHGKAPLAHINSQDQLKQHLKRPIKNDQFRSDLSPQIKELMTRCLEVNEAQRISIQEIGKLECMQNQKSGPFMSEIKVNVVRSRRLSVPSMNSMQFVRLPVKNMEKGKENKQNFGVREERGRFLSSKQLPTVKRMEKVCSDQIEENTSIMMDYRDLDLVSGNISFNQSIGLIHYCRIGFKLSQEKLPVELANGIKSVVMKILEELKVRVSSDKVTYADDENRHRKESKLKLVVNEYLGKYQREMQGQRGHFVLPHFQETLKRYLQQCELVVGQQMSQSYLCMLFMCFTSRFSNCARSNSYQFFGQNGLIDCCLDESRIPQEKEGYFSAKCRLEQSCRLATVPVAK